MASPGKMTFQQFGRSCHLRINTPEDLARVPALDEAHWVATGAPLKSLNSDAVFLDLLDTDDNHRIMCFEVADAITWMMAVLKNKIGIGEASTTLKLDSINEEQEGGRRIRDASEKILAQLGATDAGEITLEQVRKIKGALEDQPVSEAGVVLAEAAESENVKQFIAEIIDTVGGVPHPAGKDGVNEEKLVEFEKQSKAFLEWRAKGDLSGGGKTEIMPLGPASTETYELFDSLREKIDQYFAQCEAAALDRRTVDHMALSEDELKAADLGDPAAISEMMKNAPLSRPKVEPSLELDGRLNPYYVNKIDRLQAEILEPVLDRQVKQLNLELWEKVKIFFAAHEAWVKEKPATPVEKLGNEKLADYTGRDLGAGVRKLIGKSKTAAVALDNVRIVEKLILFQANMIMLANNFVSFPHLYSPESRAVFEMGTLVIDGRHLSFSVRVENRAEHSKLAKESNIFVVYAEVMPGHGKEKYEVAVPVTAGGKGNLCVGKRGLFRDIDGYESDARILQIIENPISIMEAILSPFQRVGKMLSGKVESMAAAAEKKFDKTTSGALASVGTGQRKQAQPSSGLMAGGLLMGGSVAIAALGSAFAYITKTLAPLGAVKISLGILGGLVILILPISLVAILKLRGRDLSDILEGAGWAINARMRLTLKQGRMFTEEPRLPGSVGKTGFWGGLILLGIIVLQVVYFLNKFIEK